MRRETERVEWKNSIKPSECLVDLWRLAELGNGHWGKGEGKGLHYTIIVYLIDIQLFLFIMLIDFSHPPNYSFVLPTLFLQAESMLQYFAYKISAQRCVMEVIN